MLNFFARFPKSSVPLASHDHALTTPPLTLSLAWQQHDVQELCRVMFDALEKRLRKDNHPSPELINELYQGDLKDYVKCLEVRITVE